MTKRLLAVIAAGLASAPLLASPASSAPANNVFSMVVSGGAAGCLPNAKATVTIQPMGSVENMHVVATGLPPQAGFDFFVIQVPTAPFGLTWYMGDLDADANGIAVGDFVGRFSKETFIVAPGSAPAPVEFKGSPFPDANTNPSTAPVQLYHLGVWFDSASAASAAGCPNTVTPFNGEHNAGIQVLNTSNFQPSAGPLIRIP